MTKHLHGWETVALGDLCYFSGGSGFGEKYQGNASGEFPFIKVSDLNLPGNETYITKSQNWVSDQTLKRLNAKLHPKDAVVFAKVGAALRLNRRRILSRPTAIDNNMMSAIANDDCLLTKYLYHFLTVQDFGRLAQESAIPSVNQGHLAEIVIDLPPAHEQEKISSTIDTWDAAIERTERLIATKNQLLSHLRERHLTKPKQSTRIKLKAATHESMARNGKRLGRDAIMAVTKQVGLRPMREETIAATIDRYKVVHPQAFAYNPMRLNIGSIAISSFDDDVLVSPDYVVFECDETKLLPGYLNHLRRTRLWASHFEAAGSGGVRIRIYYDDLGAFAFPLPPLAEQARVLAVLDAGVAEIETLERYLAALKTQKRGLMQKLLTGQWRVPVQSNEVAA